MAPEQFCYWLQGFAELSDDNPPTPEQWKSIREHLATVFEKVTPVLGGTVGGSVSALNHAQSLTGADRGMTGAMC